MRVYAADSPEALARVIVMAIVSDGELDPHEISVLDELEAFSQLGLSRREFLKVAKDFCGDLARSEAGTVSLLSDDIFGPVVEAVTDPAARARVSQLLLAVTSADAHQAPQEQALVAAVLDRWGIDFAAPHSAAQLH